MHHVLHIQCIHSARVMSRSLRDCTVIYWHGSSKLAALEPCPDVCLRRQVDALQLAQAFAKHCFRSVLAVNEFVTLAFEGAVLAFRVTAAHTLDAAAREVLLFGKS